MNRSSYKTLLIILGTLFIIGGMFVFFSKVVLNDPILSKIIPHSQLAWVNGSGLSFSVNSDGIQTISYDGVDFVSPAFNAGYGAYYHDEGVGAVFQAPGGATTSQSMQVGNVETVKTSDSSVCPVVRTGAQCFQQIFFSGQPNSYTLTIELSATSSNTLLVDIYVTNNDSTNTITAFNISPWFGTPMITPDLAANNDFGNFQINHISNPVALIPGSNWGSVAFFTDDYSQNKKVDFITSNTYSTVGNSTPPTNVEYLWNLNSTQSIAPNTTFNYRLYVRFGSPSDTAQTAAPEAINAFKAAYPLLINWSNRNPVARWFIAEGSHKSAINPRGYLSDIYLDVSDQANFDAQVLNVAGSIVNRMNGMNPKPQGIIIWDLEGEEFSHVFTYVGSPDKLSGVAPEMDAVADQVFQRFTDAGYKVGVTLRPSDFITGTTLPGTCNYNASGSYRDIFIKTDDLSFPRAGYECSSPNTWSHLPILQPAHQHYPSTDAGYLNNLKAKVDYAYSRWGATIFYVDSTVYGDGGTPIDAQIWQDLRTYLQTSDTTTHGGVPATSAQFLFFPENESTTYFRSTAPYNQADMGVYDTLQYVRDIYPGAFSILAHVDGSEVTHHDQLVQGLVDGNIFFLDNIWSGVDTAVQQLYLDAGISNVSTPATTYDLTYVAGSHGSLTGQASQTVTSGGSGTAVTAVADSGYHFVNWSDTVTANPRTDQSIGGNQILTANFALDGSSTGDVTSPIVMSFSVPYTSTSLTIPISLFESYDNVGVTHYMITETSSQPASSSSAWYVASTTPYVASSEGSKTLYAWSKDAAGNVSTRAQYSRVTITLPGGGGVTYSFTYGAGSNGSVTGTLSQTVASAADGSAVTAVAASGYHFVNWSDNLTTNPRTDLSASGNINVTANFAQDAAQGGGGGGGGGGSYVPPTTAVSTTTTSTSTTPTTASVNTVTNNTNTPISGPIPTVYLNLIPGTRSTAVITLQKYLIANGFLAPNLSTGYYGQLTASAVSRYRAQNASPISASSNTLTTYLFSGTNSQQVKVLQQILNKRGFTIANSGPGSSGNESTYFSTSTLVALQKFQCSGLNVCSGTPLTTGYGGTGPRTRALLNSGTYVSASTATTATTPTYVAPKTTVPAPVTNTKTTVKTTTTSAPTPAPAPTINFPTAPSAPVNNVY